MKKLISMVAVIAIVFAGSANAQQKQEPKKEAPKTEKKEAKTEKKEAKTEKKEAKSEKKAVK
jgi:Ni/Co efflux regulator RcnB